ncbi:MAG: hypothetical protein CTY25_02395 [Methylobacterium sp.]|nr:MAG: hypothetical protein CTY25_02395 [Methylobacterium sp.]
MARPAKASSFPQFVAFSALPTTQLTILCQNDVDRKCFETLERSTLSGRVEPGLADRPQRFREMEA